jgi:hypothetical protein
VSHGRERLRLSLGKHGEPLLGGLPLLTQLLTQVPHPLGEDLPDLLTMGRKRTPSITVLLPILIGKLGLEAPSMQVEPDHISGGEAKSGQGGEEQLIDSPLARHADRTGCSPSRMSSNNYQDLDVPVP